MIFEINFISIRFLFALFIAVCHLFAKMQIHGIVWLFFYGSFLFETFETFHIQFAWIVYLFRKRFIDFIAHICVLWWNCIELIKLKCMGIRFHWKYENTISPSINQFYIRKSQWKITFLLIQSEWYLVSFHIKYK